MKRIGQARIEWVLLGVIGVVCAVLSFLQYRWTGELSRAEPALLRAGLNEQVPRLARAFDEERETIKLYGIDGEGRIAPLQWPPNWERLREEMLARIKGEGRPPNTPPDSATIQLPVFADPRDRGSELEWMIFDLNQDYLRSKALPRLVTEYLNPSADAVYDVSISWPGPNGAVIFSTRSDKSSVAAGADASA